MIPDSRVFDAEKVGETLMDITPGLPWTGNFQHWPPWRHLVVEQGWDPDRFVDRVVRSLVAELVSRPRRRVKTARRARGGRR